MYTGEDHPNYVEPVEKECKRCGEVFERAHWRTTDQDQFCTQDCYYEWRAEHAESFDYGDGWNETKRERVREKYNRQCQSCGMTEETHKEVSGKRLAVHHIIPAKQIDDAERRNAVENLVALCCSCHNDWEGIPLKPTLLHHTF
jgi:5-methylcytosine-specific restriction endonuclease McrA